MNLTNKYIRIAEDQFLPHKDWSPNNKDEEEDNSVELGTWMKMQEPLPSPKNPIVPKRGHVFIGSEIMTAMHPYIWVPQKWMSKEKFSLEALRVSKENNFEVGDSYKVESWKILCIRNTWEKVTKGKMVREIPKNCRDEFSGFVWALPVEIGMDEDALLRSDGKLFKGGLLVLNFVGSS